MSTISIRTKVFFLFAAAALLTVVPALVLIASEAEDRVYSEAGADLQEAYEALNIRWQEQNEGLQQIARGLSLEPGVSEQLLASDSVALRRTLRRAMQQWEVLAFDSVGAPLLGPTVDTASINLGRSTVSFPPGAEVPLRVATWTVATDSGYHAGVVGVARPLNLQWVREMKVGVDMALIVGDSVIATTLPDSLVQVLATLDLPAVWDQRGVMLRHVEKLRYLYSPWPITDGEVPVGILLLRPVAQELALAQSILRSVVGIGAASLLLALALAFFVSRVVARPAQTLAAAAAELANGNFDAPLPRAAGDEVGQLTTAFGEMRSAIAEREGRLRATQAELIHREKLAAMGRLVAQLSHEINNPIYNIQNCLEVLDRRGDPGDPNREFLTLAREELERMATLTRQLLDQSRPLSDAARSLDLNQVVSRVLTLASSEIEENGVNITLDLDPDLPPVMAHPDAMQQAMANLIANANDAMAAGGEIMVRTRADDAFVEVSVIDSGPGIEDGHLPHIFEAFYTTKPGVSGVGLGLFVSDGIVRGHRGELRVESQLGIGTRFVMRLPRETPDAHIAASKPGGSATLAHMMTDQSDY